MKVFVAGATGVIGKRAVEQLVAAGHQVTAVARSAEKAAQLWSLGATPVAASLFDPASLRRAVAGHDVVVNLATHIPSIAGAAKPGAWSENDRIRTEGSANLVDAALAAGASRYIQESIVFTYPDSGDAWIDAESTPIEPTPMIQAVQAAEAAAARFTASGGSGVVLRFAMFYAPDASHTQSMVGAARKGAAFVAGKPSAYQPMIHADDAAAAVVAALDVPAGTYDVVDDEPLTKAEVGEVFGGRFRFPGTLALLGGSQTSPLTRSQRVSNRRFKEATGWAPRYRSFREGLPAVLAAMEPAPRRSLTARLVRPVLVVLAASALQLGLWAALAPTSFYEDFPGFGRTWVAVDGPYNEHLVRDFGQLNLAMAALLIAALLRPERYLVRVAALASLLFAVPHLLYHATHLDVYDTSDQVANMVLLPVAVVLPAILVLGTAGTVGKPWVRSGSSSLPSPEPSPATP
jgi:nucleoside-diphosphate-sugar epimerase